MYISIYRCIYTLYPIVLFESQRDYVLLLGLLYLQVFVVMSFLIVPKNGETFGK